MRPGLMDDKPNREALAELYADGATRKRIAEFFNVHKDTVSTWLQREDVQTLVSRLIRERTNRVLRHTDSKIEGILTSSKDLELDELLKIRREFANADEGGKEDNTAEAVAELMKQIRERPDLAEKLREPKP